MHVTGSEDLVLTLKYGPAELAAKTEVKQALLAKHCQGKTLRDATHASKSIGDDYPEEMLVAVRLVPSQVGREGFAAKKGVVQGVSRTGTGGRMCSSMMASRLLLLRVSRSAPAKALKIM